MRIASRKKQLIDKGWHKKFCYLPVRFSGVWYWWEPIMVKYVENYCGIEDDFTLEKWYSNTEDYLGG